MNADKDDIKTVNENIIALEGEKSGPVIAQPKPLTQARNEYELKEITKLPDCVKELQVFKGEFDNYASGWAGPKRF